MMKNQVVLAVMLSCVAINVMAEDWNAIIKKPDYEILVDIDSYNTAKGYPYILTKTIYKKPQAYPVAKIGLRYQYVVKSTQFNCKQPLYKTTRQDFYSSQHKLLASDKSTPVFKPFVLGSDEFSVAQLVCQVHQMVGGQ